MLETDSFLGLITKSNGSHHGSWGFKSPQFMIKLGHTIHDDSLIKEIDPKLFTEKMVKFF